MILLIRARFNSIITEKLRDSAISVLEKAEQKYEVIDVPGAIEIPITVQHFLKTGKYQAAIALGCVIQGGTDHYDLVLQSCTDGLTRVSLDEGIPVMHGILACKNFDQAWKRRSLGKDYAETTLEMIKTLK